MHKLTKIGKILLLLIGIVLVILKWTIISKLIMSFLILHTTPLIFGLFFLYVASTIFGVRQYYNYKYHKIKKELRCETFVDKKLIKLTTVGKIFLLFIFIFILIFNWSVIISFIMLITWSINVIIGIICSTLVGLLCFWILFCISKEWKDNKKELIKKDKLRRAKIKNDKLRRARTNE